MEKSYGELFTAVRIFIHDRNAVEERGPTSLTGMKDQNPVKHIIVDYAQFTRQKAHLVSG